MARLFGIDIGSRSVRVAVLHTSYRKVAIEALLEQTIDEAGVGDAIRSVLASAGRGPNDPLAVALDGTRAFVRDLTLPKTAQKQLESVLPFEIEAQLPIELETATYDHIVLRRTSDEPVHVVAVAARTEDVQARIDMVRDAIGSEPDRVGVGAFALSSLTLLAPTLAGTGAVALLSIGDERSEILVLDKGEPAFARTVARGTVGLPGTAPALARELRQSFSGFHAACGHAVERVVLCGPGASVAGAEAFLQAELDLPLELLPALKVEPLAEELAAEVPRFAPAIGLAASFLPKGRAIDLRRGALAFTRTYDFIRDKIPILVGLGVVVTVSFFFSTWAELRALDKQKETLQAALGTISLAVLGEETRDPARVTELLDKGKGATDEDPLPHVDAFDVLIALSKAVPENMKHDVEELDIQRGKLSIHGVVPTIPDAQSIATEFAKVRCFQDVKIVRTNQAVTGDAQKYLLEADLKCPTEKEKPKPKATSPDGSATAPAPSASAGEAP